MDNELVYLCSWSSAGLRPEAFPLLLAMSFVLGCCIGSFLNVVIWRLPRGESLSYPGSHCPRCGHIIRAWENIPLLSWVFLRGRCSGCHQPISVRYPLGEAACGLLYVLEFCLVWYSGASLAYLPGMFYLTGSCLAAAWIDVQHHRIPNGITYSGMIVALLLALLLPEGNLGQRWIDANPLRLGAFSRTAVDDVRFPFSISRWQSLATALAGGVAGWGIPALFGWLGGRAWRWLHADAKEKCVGMGGGDLKFCCMLGLFFGCWNMLGILLGSSLLALLFAAMYGMFRRRFPASLPYGPFLAVASLLCFGMLCFF